MSTTIRNERGWARLSVLIGTVVVEMGYLMVQGVAIDRQELYRLLLWVAGVVATGIGLLLLWSAKVQWDNRAALVEVKTTLSGEGGVLDRLTTAEVEIKGFDVKLQAAHKHTVGIVTEILANVQGAVENQTERIDKLFERPQQHRPRGKRQ